MHFHIVYLYTSQYESSAHARYYGHSNVARTCGHGTRCVHAMVSLTMARQAWWPNWPYSAELCRHCTYDGTMLMRRLGVTVAARTWCPTRGTRGGPRLVSTRWSRAKLWAGLKVKIKICSLLLKTIKCNHVCIVPMAVLVLESFFIMKS